MIYLGAKRRGILYFTSRTINDSIDLMIRDLTENEIHELLGHESYGRLGCLSPENRIYIVPITYVYKENALYIFSFEGKEGSFGGQKIDYMRKNPSICFQTDRKIDDIAWQSVIAWGTFEELKGEDRYAGFDLLIERLWSESNKDHPIYFPFRSSPEMLESAKNDKNAVIFRINIEEKTGRMEHYGEGTI